MRAGKRGSGDAGKKLHSLSDSPASTVSLTGASPLPRFPASPRIIF
jgi:hypothetical protein